MVFPKGPTSGQPVRFLYVSNTAVPCWGLGALGSPSVGGLIHSKHVSGLAGLGEHVFITAIGLNQRMFWLK